MSFWDDLGGFLGGAGSFLGGAGQIVSPFLGNLFNRNRGGGNYGPPQQQGPTPEEWMKQWAAMMEPPEMPDFSEMYAGLFDQMNGMMGAQQGMFAEQQAAMKADQQKALARQAAGARKNLQERGVAYDPLSGDQGAAGSASIASMLGIPPDELLQALQSYGNDYGFKV